MATFFAIIQAHWGLILMVFGSTAFTSAVATVVTLYGDPDHNPATPPPKWVIPFVVLQGILTIRASAGRKGLDGFGDGRWSFPGHFPQIGDPVPSRSGVSPSSSGPALIFALLSVITALTGCGTALDKARIATTAAAELGLSTGKFVASLNEQKEAEIVAAVEVDHDAAKAKLARDNWRATYDKLDKAVKAYSAIVTGVRAGTELAASSKKLDLGKVVQELLRAGQALKAALAVFGVNIPGGDLI